MDLSRADTRVATLGGATYARATWPAGEQHGGVNVATLAPAVRLRHFSGNAHPWNGRMRPTLQLVGRAHSVVCQHALDLYERDCPETLAVGAAQVLICSYQHFRNCAHVLSGTLLKIYYHKNHTNILETRYSLRG